MMRSSGSVAGEAEPGYEIDLRAMGAALNRRRGTILLTTIAVALLVAVFVNVVSPRYTSEAQVLLENQETFFTAPDRVNQPTEQLLDGDAVQTQVQLVSSPDIARRAIKELGLAGNPEFDPSARVTISHLVSLLLGLAHEGTSETAESRITQSFLDRLMVFSPLKTRTITIQFSSKDPQLAARAANVVAELYIEEQSAAKRAMAKESADALALQITDLRVKLATADAERESYRLQTGLLTGSNNLTINGQQLADINSELSKARTIQADAQAKASQIRELLRGGKAADITSVINTDIVRHIWDARSTAQAELALESRTLLPGHPRIKALLAQMDEYDSALKFAAKQAAMSLESEAKVAGTRVANLETVLTHQKTAAGESNADEVHLRALELTTQGYKDQLESTSTKYQEALARQSSDATPADARIISRATASVDPTFPKKIPLVVFSSIATLVLCCGFVVAGQFLSDGDGKTVVPALVRTAPLRERTTADVPPRRTSDMLRRFAGEPEGGPDLAFGPIDEPRARDTRTPPKASLMASVVTYLKGFGLSAADSRVFEEPADGSTDALVARSVVDAPVPADQMSDIEASRRNIAILTDRIVATHVPGRGLHIVGTSLGNEAGTTAILVDLSRSLAGRGRAIVVDLNRAPIKLASLCESGSDGRAKILAMSGLSELLAGEASFAEVIHRDHGSRLHFIPTGRSETDFRDFDLILDALSETYDFVVLLAPAFPQSEIAKVMAPYADFVVLTSATEPDHAMLRTLEKELVEAGAREVLVAGSGANMRGQGVA